MKLVNRLFATSLGPLYVMVDYDGVHALLFGSDGQVLSATDAATTAEDQVARVLCDELALDPTESRDVAHKLREVVADEDETQEPPVWVMGAVMLGTVGVWLIGIAALIGGVVYLVLQVV